MKEDEVDLKPIPEFLIPTSHCKALIFDLDGTLADTMPMHLESWQMIAKKYGYRIKDQMGNDRAGTPTIQLAVEFNREYGWSLNPEEVYKDKNAFYAELLMRGRPILPIRDVYHLAEFYHEKLKMAIGTGSTREDALMAIGDLKVANWFSVMVTADDVTQGKPHPETYLKCAQRLDIDPSMCVVYEDGPMGIQAALNAGMSAINVITKERHIRK